MLLFALRRERRIRLDAFVAVDSLRRHGPLTPPAAYSLAAALAFLGGGLGFEARLEARLVAGALPALVVWLAWLRVWSEHRALLDAAIVFQDHVPLRERPPNALAPAPYAAISFRPMTAAAALLAALTLSGVAFGFASAAFGLTRVAPVALATYAIVGTTFAASVKRGLAAERSVRGALGTPAEASDSALLDALRRNPRSSVLLVAHATLLAAAGEREQALLEYEAARLPRRHPALDAPMAALADARPSPDAPLAPGVIARLPGEPEARMHVAPLALPPDAARVQVLDARALVRELVATPEDGLLFAVQGTLADDLRDRLAPYAHLSPLVVGDSGAPPRAFGAWRLEPASRAELADYAGQHDIATDWDRVALFTLDRLLADGRLRLRTLLVDPAFCQREFAEWRRAAAVVGLAE